MGLRLGVRVRVKGRAWARVRVSGQGQWSVGRVGVRDSSQHSGPRPKAPGLRPTVRMASAIVGSSLLALAWSRTLTR